MLFWWVFTSVKKYFHPTWQYWAIQWFLTFEQDEICRSLILQFCVEWIEVQLKIILNSEVMSENGVVHVSAGPTPCISTIAVFSKSRIASSEYIYKQKLLPRSREKSERLHQWLETSFYNYFMSEQVSIFPSPGFALSYWYIISHIYKIFLCAFVYHGEDQ